MFCFVLNENYAFPFPLFRLKPSRFDVQGPDWRQGAETAGLTCPLGPHTDSSTAAPTASPRPVKGSQPCGDLRPGQPPETELRSQALGGSGEAPLGPDHNVLVDKKQSQPSPTLPPRPFARNAAPDTAVTSSQVLG